VRSSASSFNFQCTLISLKSSSSCLSLRRPLSFTSIPSAITCCRRQLLPKMSPIQLAYLLFVVFRIFLSYFTRNISFFIRSIQLIYSLLGQDVIFYKSSSLDVSSLLTFLSSLNMPFLCSAVFHACFFVIFAIAVFLVILRP